MRDLGLQWVIEPDSDSGFIGRAFVCGAMAVTDEEISLAEAEGADLPDDHEFWDPDIERDADEIFESYTGHRVPSQLCAEFDQGGELYLIAIDDDWERLTATLQCFGSVSYNGFDPKQPWNE